MTKYLFDKMFENPGHDMPKSSDMDRTVGIDKHECENTSASGPTKFAHHKNKKNKKSNYKSDHYKPQGMFGNLDDKTKSDQILHNIFAQHKDIPEFHPNPVLKIDDSLLKSMEILTNQHFGSNILKQED